MAKRIPPLTDRQVLNAKAKAQTYKLFDGGGLYLEVAPGGSKLWKLKYRRPGLQGKTETRMALGAYPAVSLAEARAQREEARRLLLHGLDPGDERRAAEAERLKQASMTFEKCSFARRIDPLRLTHLPLPGKRCHAVI
jgi:hypothetical protein